MSVLLNLGSFLSLQAGQSGALQTCGVQPNILLPLLLSLPLLQELGGVRNDKYLQKSIRSHSPTPVLKGREAEHLTLSYIRYIYYYMSDWVS